MYYLALLCPPVKEVLSQMLQKDPTIGTRGVMAQIERLMNKPLQEVKYLIPAGLLVVVIDALDECSGHDDTWIFLRSLLGFAGDLPAKFFVTCRPDIILLSQQSSGGGVLRSLLHLHNIKLSLVQADIKTYLRFELWPLHVPEDSIKLLVVQSGKLFIYTATAVCYIQDQNELDDCDRLEVMLDVGSSLSGEAHESLDALYTAILSQAFGGEKLKPRHADKIKLVLDTVVCAREPLTITDLVSQPVLGLCTKGRE